MRGYTDVVVVLNVVRCALSDYSAYMPRLALFTSTGCRGHSRPRGRYTSCHPPLYHISQSYASKLNPGVKILKIVEIERHHTRMEI